MSSVAFETGPVETGILILNSRGDLPTATYTIEAGTLDADDLYVGTGGTGHFVQHGGTVRVTDWLELTNRSTFSSSDGSGEGRYDISGGSLSTRGLSLGRNGTGIFNQSQSSVDVTGTLDLAGTSRYTISSGDFAANALRLRPDDSGESIFVQDGGDVSVASHVEIEGSGDALASLERNGGTFAATTLELKQRSGGTQPPASFRQTAGI
ncbi:unnamed protein product, partial [Ectocarpus fasciculatus]